MEKDETTVVPTETETEQTEETETASASDPLDSIEDVNELRSKAKAFRSQANRYKGKAKETKITSREETPRETVKPSDILRSQEFALHREGYNEDEIDLIMRNGGREILKNENNPLVMGLKAARVQRQAEEAASKVSGGSGMSEIERKYSRADIEKMSPAEIEKILGFAQ